MSVEVKQQCSETLVVFNVRLLNYLTVNARVFGTVSGNSSGWTSSHWNYDLSVIALECYAPSEVCNVAAIHDINILLRSTTLYYVLRSTRSRC